MANYVILNNWWAGFQITTWSARVLENLLRKDKLLEQRVVAVQADAVQAEAMAGVARHSGGISASVEEQVSLQLFEEPLNAYTG